LAEFLVINNVASAFYCGISFDMLLIKYVLQQFFQKEIEPVTFALIYVLTYPIMIHQAIAITPYQHRVLQQKCRYMGLV